VPERQPDPFGAVPSPGGAPVLSACWRWPVGGGEVTSRVLLLNATFEPLAVVTAKRAVLLMLSGKAELVQAALEGGAFRSESLSVAMPSVMRLSRYVRVPYRSTVPMTRAGVLRRDGRVCAYCAKRADTIDHVVPRSRGGMHTWDNCVASVPSVQFAQSGSVTHRAGLGSSSEAGPAAAGTRGSPGVERGTPSHLGTLARDRCVAYPYSA